MVWNQIVVRYSHPCGSVFFTENCEELGHTPMEIMAMKDMTKTQVTFQ